MNRGDAKTQRRKIQGLFCLRFPASLRFTLILVAMVAGSCSLPSLEKRECTEAREVVKKFYSFHFGNETHPSAENLTARETFLTRDLLNNLRVTGEQSKDYFTATDTFPKAFRIGSCNLEAEDKAILQVLLFWRDDTKNEQKEVKVETLKTDGKWLINKVFN